MQLLYLQLLPTRGEYSAMLSASFRTLTMATLGYQMGFVMMVISLCLVCWSFLREELERYTEKRLMVERSGMINQRYENLRRHNEEVMMLRHDMNRHVQLLRQMTTDERTGQYLDELIGRNEKIRPVLQSGN